MWVGCARRARAAVPAVERARGSQTGAADESGARACSIAAAMLGREWARAALLALPALLALAAATQDFEFDDALDTVSAAAILLVFSLCIDYVALL